MLKPVLVGFALFSVGSAADPSSFLERITEMNRAEIQFARMALNKSRDSRVRRFAQTVVDSHTRDLLRSDRLFTTHSDTQSFSLLTAEHQKTLEVLSALAESQFDRAFTNVMVDEHQHVIRLLYQEAGIVLPRHSVLRRPAPPIPGNMAGLARELLPAQEELLAQARKIERDFEFVRDVQAEATAR